MKKILSLIIAIALICAIVIPILAADGVGTTIRLGQTKGIVAVRNASGNFRSARKDMRLYNGYSVQTAYSSQAYMTLDDTKAAKLDSLSKAEVKKSGKQLEIKLQTGKLYFGVDKPLSSDESLNICTSTMVTGVRGSYGWVEPNLMGLIHGHVTVTCRNPYTGEVRVTEVTSGQIVYFDPYADGAGAEPQLLEIDFIKRLMKNEDVPSFVIEEIRLSPELQELINEDVENLDVPTLLGLEEEKRAAEEAELAEKEAGIEAAMAEQDAEITGAEQYYVAPTESTSSYIVTLPTGGDYTINGVTGGTMVDATHYSVVSGNTLTFTLFPNAGFSVYEDYLSVSAEGAAVTISQNGTNCDVSFNVYGNRTVSVDSGVFFETDIAGLAAALTAHDEVVLTGTGALAGNQNVANDKTLLLKADLSVNSPNMLTLDAAGTGTNPGKLIIDSGVTLTTDNGSTVTNNGKLENYGTANIDGELSSTLGSEIVNYTGGTMNFSANGRLSGAPTVDNRGYLVVSNIGDHGINLSGGSLNISGQLETTTANGVLVNYNTPVEISGLLTIGAGTTFEAGLTGTAAFTITDTGTVVNNGTFFPRPASMAVNRGTITNNQAFTVGCNLDSYSGLIENVGTATMEVMGTNIVYYNETLNGALTYTGSGSVVDSPAP